jgi:hypothetical protein
MDDVIELSSLDFNENVDFGSAPKKSTNFGGGLEFLMNDKVKESSKPTSDIDLEDLDALEEEMNELVEDDGHGGGSFKSKSDFFSMDKSDEPHSVRFSDGPSSTSGIGKATADSSSGGDGKTWDNYGKFNNIPMNPDKHVSSEPKLSKEDMLREKFRYLRKLEALEKKGVELSKKYTMESSLMEMQGEYETIMDEKSKQNSVKFQGNIMMAIVNGIEFLNNRFDPFDVKLEGWSDQVNENINDYDDVFAELYEKYKSKASMAPELKLLFQLGGSAMMVHMSNTLFKSAMPGMDDILRQNPDLMRSFQNAAVNSMAGSSPGFSGFMSGIMNPEPQVPRGNGPPPPMATQGPNAPPPPANRPGNNNYSNRPDLSMGRNMNMNMNDGINIRENFGRGDDVERSGRRQQAAARPEMKGPSNISDILSGIKTKTINIQQPQGQGGPQQQAQTKPIQIDTEPTSPITNVSMTNNDSTISISDLKDLQTDGNFPKRSKRRQKSSSNTISLDI